MLYEIAEKLEKHLKPLEQTKEFKRYKIDVKTRIGNGLVVIIAEQELEYSDYVPITDQISYGCKNGDKLEIDIRIEQYNTVKLNSLIVINSRLNKSIFDFLLSGGAEQ